ncbi:unnamed protein product [Schistosoma rodhaini]|uniref:PH domain-containing protein n=3 Tax=Schistosoma rodhaini TaxID=6188 RepID=A0AA85FY04_9TREM|nr:unnamed protein product [Schistosoma rodhaini]
MVSNSKVLSTGDVIICGYLMKSRRIKLLRKLLWNLHCMKHSSEFSILDWKRRYFILYKVHSQNKTEIFFDYYKDETVTKFKGRVDLEHCECIVENVNIGQPCAFSISTLFNGNKRIYYFIAANNKIMSDWVHHLARVAELVDVSTTNINSNQRTVVENINSSRSAGGVCNEPPLFQKPSKISPDNYDNGVHSNGGDTGTKSPNNQRQVLSNNHVNRDNDNGEDDYKEVIGGVDYLLSGSELLLDDYHHLPNSRHSYVNLTNTVVTEKEFNINYSSLPRIDKMKQTSGDIIFKSSNDNINDQKNKYHHVNNPTISSSKNSLKRQNSSNSVYYNVWDSEDGSKVTTTTTTTNDTTSVTTDSIIDSEIYLKRNNQITQNTRIYRKSHCVPGSSSTLSPSPLLHSSFDQKSGRQCLLMKTETGTKISRKPAPPPRMSPLKSSSFTLPPTFTNSTNVLSGLNLESPLPVRAKGLDMSVDSSLNSSSTSSDVNIAVLNDTTHENANDGCDNNEYNNNNINGDDNLDRNHNMVDREINEDNKENRILLVDHHCSINAIDKNQPNSNITLTKSGISINKISHLNYIEPYNLDLRTFQCSKEHGNSSVDGSGSSNLSSSRTNTLTTTSVLKTGSASPILTTTTIINSDISSNVTGSLNMSNTVCSNSFDKQLSTNGGLQQTITMSLTHPHSLSSSSTTTTTITTSTNINPLLSPSQSDSSVFLNSNKTLISCNGTSNNVATTNSTINQLDDEHIEYREIDPIGTNALAIVKERFG